MKKQLLNLVLGSLLLMLCACASQKQVRSSENGITNSTYTADDTVAQHGDKKPELGNNETVIHVVQKGESLWVIAQKYGVTVKAIAEANNIENTSLIKINQELIIPKKK